MGEIKLNGKLTRTSGSLPEVGSIAPDATVTTTELADVTLSSFPGKRILNIFPSLDTPVCAASVRIFAKEATQQPGVTVLNVSMDLPFAQKRFAALEGLERVHLLSAFRSDFPTRFGLRIEEGGMRGLCSRAVIVLDEANRVLYTEQVPEIAQEPDYDAALASV